MKTITINPNRNYGIDALRMLAMFMVVNLHVLGQGGILTAAPAMSMPYEIAWFLKVFTYCAVNCYALISGYVGVNSKYKYSNLALLWLRVVFYTVLITLVFQVVRPEEVVRVDWINAICPTMSNTYWYFTSYFVMFFFIPILNLALNTFDKKQMRSMLIGLVVCISVFQTLFNKDVFSTGSGYSPWWLIILYLIGGYMKKYCNLENVSKIKLMLGYVSLVIFTWLYKYIVEYRSVKITGIIQDGSRLIRYTSPTMLLASILLVILFLNLKLGDLSKKIIAFIAPMAFSVYIIHSQTFIWRYYITGKFVSYASFPWYLEIIAVLGTALIIYIACSFVDIVREQLFKILKIKKHLENLENKFIQNN